MSKPSHTANERYYVVDELDSWLIQGVVLQRVTTHDYEVYDFLEDYLVDRSIEVEACQHLDREEPPRFTLIFKSNVTRDVLHRALEEIPEGRLDEIARLRAGPG